MADGKLLHLASFAAGEVGGNPAGVWIGDELPAPGEMQRIAADVGASETAFIAPASGSRRTVRYYSPEIEVSFCGHATIASGIALGENEGESEYIFETPVGDVEVSVLQHGDKIAASLRSVDTKQEPISGELLQEALDCLHWTCDDLDAALPPTRAFAGAWHLVIAVASRAKLGGLDYDFDALRILMEREGLTTLQLVYRESETLFHSRNPFPIGGIVEDPATGAAAAALGGYLRDAGLIPAPFKFEIRQGEDMGMPSLIHVEVPETGGVLVAGTAREM